MAAPSTPLNAQKSAKNQIFPFGLQENVRSPLLSICYLYRACVDRERSDLEDRPIFAREPA